MVAGDILALDLEGPMKVGDNKMLQEGKIYEIFTPDCPHAPGYSTGP